MKSSFFIRLIICCLSVDVSRPAGLLPCRPPRPETARPPERLLRRGKRLPQRTQELIRAPPDLLRSPSSLLSAPPKQLPTPPEQLPAPPKTHIPSQPHYRKAHDFLHPSSDGWPELPPPSEQLPTPPEQLPSPSEQLPPFLGTNYPPNPNSEADQRDSRRRKLQIRVSAQ